MDTLRTRRLPHRLLGFGLALGLLGASIGIVGAAIPESGVYTGCYNKNSGALRVIDVAVASQKCTANERQITWSQTGPAGADGANGADGIDGTDGKDAMSESFWSGLDSKIVGLSIAGGRGRLASTGPIPAGWWAVTGQLRVGVPGPTVLVTCVLESTAPGQTFGGLALATVFSGDLSDSTGEMNIPIRMVVDASAATSGSIANIQCVASPSEFSSTLEMHGDLMIIPSEQGQVGVAP